jgi:SAM-dependent methyltransferase
MAQEQPTKSRFVVAGDPRTETFVYPIPAAFWSRPYEYQWAANFCRADDVVLDAASGVVHPLQYYLADHCRNVFACDLDPRLGSRAAIEQAARENGVGDVLVQERYFERIHRSVCSLTQMPYENLQFDKIFCISTLEHLKDRYNKFAFLGLFRPVLGGWLRRDIQLALAEFARTLKVNGLLILTFDYPRVNLPYFSQVAHEAGFEFADEVDFSLPNDALYEKSLGLYCFRAVMRKRADSI